MFPFIRNRIPFSFKLFFAISTVLIAATATAQMLEEKLIQDMRWRNVGPANMSGRISDIEALDDDFTTVVVAAASGGVWKSINAGTTWVPIFDRYGSSSIGDVAIYQKDPNILWVGTGEKNPRNSVSWGDGIYKSTDGGTTFTNMGLRDTHTIGKVISHPADPDTVYVAALGCVWGYIGQRGVFKTTDGGKTWKKLTNGLPDDGKTGAIDMVMDPRDPDVLYVGFWQFLRQPFRADSGGPNGGIFKTLDGGENWQKLTSGLPKGDTGKIGLAISRSNPNVLMAMVEHGYQPAPDDPDYEDMSKLGSGLYRSEDGGDSWKYMNRYQSRPFYYCHVHINPKDDKLVYVLGGWLMMSTDGGHTLEEAPRGIHSDFHAMWIDPNNKDRFYVGNDGGVSLTHDHGNSYILFENFSICQFYTVGVDMRDPYYVCGGRQDYGTWCGPSHSRETYGILTDHWYWITTGDGFHVQIDPTDWRIAYSEPHPGGRGGNIFRTNVETRISKSIRPQKGGNIVNYDDYITPEIEELQLEKGWGPSPGEGSGAFRWNWSSPILMSPHNPSTIFYGANHLFKSIDRGDSWYLISPDLSKNDPYKTKKESGGMTPDHERGGGAEFHGTIVTISESPVKAGVIWIGTDDGNVQVTRNGGVHWTNVRSNVPGPPEDLWVSCVEASHFDEGTAYLTIDGHRSANFKPWIFKTTDYGQTWTNITHNLPDGHPAYVIKEDPKNPNLLFVGTEFAAFFSINGGRTWTRLNKNMPTVAVHDLVIHPRDNDLIAATHGRGMWIMDDITPLQQVTEEVLASDAHLFENRVATRWLEMHQYIEADPESAMRGHFYYRGENPPNAAFIHYYLGSSISGPVQIEISDITGELTRTYTIPSQTGVNRLQWDMYWDTTLEQRKKFVENISRRIDQLLKRATGEQRHQLDQLRNQIQQAGTDTELLLDIQERLKEVLGRRFRRRDEMKGHAAEPGEYLVKIAANGKTYTGKIMVRQDPLLNSQK